MAGGHMPGCRPERGASWSDGGGELSGGVSLPEQQPDGDPSLLRARLLLCGGRPVLHRLSSGVVLRGSHGGHELCFGHVLLGRPGLLQELSSWVLLPGGHAGAARLPKRYILSGQLHFVHRLPQGILLSTQPIQFNLRNGHVSGTGLSGWLLHFRSSLEGL